MKVLGTVVLSLVVFVQTTSAQLDWQFNLVEYRKPCPLNETTVLTSAEKRARGGACGLAFKCYPCDNTQRCKDLLVGQCAPCFRGEYCPEGSINNLAWIGQLQCPEGFYCATPETKEPCKPGHFCAEGTWNYTAANRCEDGFGLVCVNGSKAQVPCPKGYYCPNTSAQVICPEGHFCGEYTMEPRACPRMSACPEGSHAPAHRYVGVVVFVAFVAVLYTVERYLQFRRNVHVMATQLRVARKAKHQSVMHALAAWMLGGRVSTMMLTSKLTGFRVKAVPLTIKWEGLRLVLPTGTCVLQGVEGVLHPGHVTAIMGPSGSGKSTLLNVLCGRVTGMVEGTTLINDEVRPLADIKRVMGVVPQDDVLFGDLTCRENLLYSARLRLPPKRAPEIQTMLDTTLEVLGIIDVQHSQVGSVSVRGVSGGQRKRVNIGMEMITDPAVLFLDEPTSGLSSSSALIVMKALKALSYTQSNVAAVIHQPRVLVFQMFNDVILLVKGGHVVYCGACSRALVYFTRLGFPEVGNENPADYLLDVIEGAILPKSYAKGKRFDPHILIQVWQEGAAVVNKQLNKIKARPQMTNVLTRHSELKGGLTLANKLKSGRRDDIFITEQGEVLVGENALAAAKKVSAAAQARKMLDAAKFGQDAFDDEASPDAPDASKEHTNILDAFTRAWKEVDVNGDMSLSTEEVGELLAKNGMELSQEELGYVMDELDTDNTGDVHFNEFVEYINRLSILVEGSQLQLASDKSGPDGGPDAAAAPGADDTHQDLQTALSPPRLPIYLQLIYILKRCFVQWLRHMDTHLVHILMLFAGGVVVSMLLAGESKYASVPSNMCLTTVTIGVLVSVNCIIYLGDDQEMYRRERFSGVSGTSFFLAKMLVMQFDTVWMAFVFLCAYYNFIHTNLRFLKVLEYFILTAWATSGIGVAMSVLFDKSNALLTATVLPLVLGVFLAGVQPTIPEMPPVVKFFAKFSFTRWSTEALTVAELRLEQQHNLGRIQRTVFDKYDYDVDNIETCELALALMGLAWRLLAYAGLCGWLRVFPWAVSFVAGHMRRSFDRVVATQTNELMHDFQDWTALHVEQSLGSLKNATHRVGSRLSQMASMAGSLASSSSAKAEVVEEEASGDEEEENKPKGFVPKKIATGYN